MKFHLFFLAILLGTSSLYAQLPEDFITKVTYQEDKIVTYEMVDSESVNCLTLGELSVYHGYVQHMKQTEVIDTQGDLLSETAYLYERNVRDDWMEGYSLISMGKDSIDVYGDSGDLILRSARYVESNPVYLTEEKAANYKLYLLDDSFYSGIISVLDSHDISYTNQNNIITASLDALTTYVYDDNTKSVLTTEYDSLMNKTKETAVQYDFSYDSLSYFPATETTIEWILTKNGCCVKKTTTYTRHGFYREVDDNYQTEAPPSQDNNHFATRQLNADYAIMTVANSNQFMVKSEKHEGQPIQVAIYDLGGKLLVSQSITEGEPTPLPGNTRAGMYLVHVTSTDQSKTIVGKVIIPNSQNQF